MLADPRFAHYMQGHQIQQLGQMLDGPGNYAQLPPIYPYQQAMHQVQQQEQQYTRDSERSSGMAVASDQQIQQHQHQHQQQQQESGDPLLPWWMHRADFPQDHAAPAQHSMPGGSGDGQSASYHQHYQAYGRDFRTQQYHAIDGSEQGQQSEQQHAQGQGRHHSSQFASPLSFNAPHPNQQGEQGTSWASHGALAQHAPYATSGHIDTQDYQEQRSHSDPVVRLSQQHRDSWHTDADSRYQQAQSEDTSSFPSRPQIQPEQRRSDGDLPSGEQAFQQQQHSFNHSQQGHAQYSQAPHTWPFHYDCATASQHVSHADISASEQWPSHGGYYPPQLTVRPDSWKYDTPSLTGDGHTDSRTNSSESIDVKPDLSKLITQGGGDGLQRAGHGEGQAQSQSYAHGMAAVGGGRTTPIDAESYLPTNHRTMELRLPIRKRKSSGEDMVFSATAANQG